MKSVFCTKESSPTCVPIRSSPSVLLSLPEGLEEREILGSPTEMNGSDEPSSRKTFIHSVVATISRPNFVPMYVCVWADPFSSTFGLFQATMVAVTLKVSALSALDTIVFRRSPAEAFFLSVKLQHQSNSFTISENNIAKLRQEKKRTKGKKNFFAFSHHSHSRRTLKI